LKRYAQDIWWLSPVAGRRSCDGIIEGQRTPGCLAINPAQTRACILETAKSLILFTFQENFYKVKDKLRSEY
jgi:hypothetical protein